MRRDRGALMTRGRWFLAALLAFFALGALTTPAAHADGDPGSDVLVYQDLFVASDSGVSIQQQVELANLLGAAARDGFPIRVAIIAAPDDLGAITALWRKPAAYASFLGIELSLAYKQRLLVVMPNGFGINWPGHPTASAYRLLASVPAGSGGSGFTRATVTAVRTLAAASGVKLPALAGDSAGTSAPTADGAAGSAGTGSKASGGRPAAAAPSGFPARLAARIALAVLATLAAAALLILIARRRGLRLAALPGALAGLGKRALPQRLRRPVPGTWVAASLVLAATAGIIIHAVAGPAASTSASTAQSALLAGNSSLDPGTSLSGTAPGFTLTDQFGQPVSLRSYRGKVVILAFNDSECTTICPMTTTALLDAKTMLGAAGSQVQLLGIDANPKATAVEDVLSYSQLHGMLYQWRFLTGSLPQLQSVWKAYSVGVTISQNLIDHTPAVFVIAPDGNLAKLYLTQQSYSAVGQLGQLLADEASRLLPSHPPVQSHLSYAQIAGASPAATTTLPRAEGGSVSIGPGHPGQARLYLFFATWDQEITSLAGQLDALDSYQLAAGAAGLPSLTAVDEGSVEPSPSALTRFLSGLPKPLWYQVAVDRSGQVADGYQVQGVPWFALVSPSGQILWSWEVSTSGWLTRAALDQHVRAALAHAGNGM
jgi:cytochrome oxidase Cu insertion factor (SCO1/SenC/PrrC family)